jgi:hypothetical protein
MHHVSEGGGGKAAGCKGNPGSHVDRYPQSPRILIVQVRHRPDTEEEPACEKDQSVQCNE